MEGLRRHQDRVRFVLVHHEEAAAFMATGYVRATGKLGVCLATSGPGGIHLLNGLCDAKLDHVPVLAITGMQETSGCRTRSASSTRSRAGRLSATSATAGSPWLMAEFLTAVQHNLPVKIVISNNNSLGQIL
jgi:thiamine pyrophosphate-dependent acetolactate synthase large subunit-like protein